MGSVVADLQAELFAAVRGNDLARARALNDRLHPLAEMFYAEPFIDMHNRMKEALVLLGRLEHAFVRPPLVKARGGGNRAHRGGARGGRVHAEAEAVIAVQWRRFAQAWLFVVKGSLRVIPFGL